MTHEDAVRVIAWDMYFAGLVSINFHPKAGEHGARSVEDCAAIADSMLIERDRRFAKEVS